MTKLSDPGVNIGPPQDKEYAVEPVGVAIIKPSAQYVFKNWSFISACIFNMDDESFLINVISLSAN